jgi:hypothetical protein
MEISDPETEQARGPAKPPRAQSASGKPRDVKLAVLALALVAFHALELLLFGFGLATCFVVLIFFGLILIVPVAAVYLLVAMAVYWKTFTAKQKLIRMALFLSLLLIVLLHLRSPLFLICSPLTDWGIRLRVAISGGVDNLQTWAIEILEKPADEVGESELSIYRIKKEAMSKQVRGFNASYVYIVPGYQGREPHVRIIWGGGFHHWGIFVGPRGFHAESDQGQRIYRWCDGVYGYHEIQ